MTPPSNFALRIIVEEDPRGDLIAPFEQGRRLAAGIPGAHFVALQGQNHLFMEHEPASDRFFEEVKLFLGQ